MSEPNAIRSSPAWGATREVYRFGPFRLDVPEGTLLRDGQSVRLTAKVFDTLVLFVRNSGRLLTREELSETLWPDAVVQDANLTQNVWMLRRALGAEGGDGAEDKDERYIQTVPRRGYRFVAPVAPVMADEGPRADAAGPLPQAAPRQPGRWRRVVAVTALVLTLTAAGLLLARRLPDKSAPVAGATPRRAVAIPSFRNLSGRADDAWLAVALPEMLGTELRGAQQLRLIPGDNVARASADLSWKAGATEGGAGADLGRRLGADLLVLGSYARSTDASADKVRLDVRVEEAPSGRVLASLAETGGDSELFDLVSRLGGKMRLALALLPDEAGRAGLARLAMPSDPKAARLYAEGLASLRRADAPAARDALVAATAIEPQAAVTHSALAAAWLALGYDSRARSEAERAFGLSAELPQEERLQLEGVYRETAGEWDRAIEIYRTLGSLFPDDIEHGLRLVTVQRLSGKGRDALVTVESLRRLPHAQDDPRLDLTEAQAAAAVSDFRRQQVAAARATAAAERLGIRSLAGRARLSEGGAWSNLGQPQEALAALAAAKAACDAAADAECLASVANNTGSVMDDLGDTASARSFYEESLRLAQPLGNLRLQSGTLNNVAILLKLEGDLSAAARMYERALAMKREVGDRPGEARILSNLAALRLASGTLAEARKLQDLALGIRRDVGDRRGLAMTLCIVAETAMVGGDLRSARRALDESLAVGRETGLKQGIACALDHMGALQALEGDVAGGRKSYADSIALWQELGERVNAAATLVGASRLELWDERPGEAEALLRKALEALASGKRPLEEAAARIALAQVYLAEGQLDKAQEAVGAAASLLQKKPYRLLQLDRALAAAQIEGARGSYPQAATSLRAVVAESRQRGLVPRELEARLAMAKVEAQAGHSAEACRLTAEVKRDALARGLGQFARPADCKALAARR